jgi:ABC-type transport system substrate-binding protein/DNA-binding SARP family transcriptional activator
MLRIPGKCLAALVLLASMDFVLLGPVQATRDGASIGLGGPKQRSLLAMLLLARGRPVSRDRLIEGIWGEAPPDSASATLDSYISRLRRALGAERVERRPPGYALRLEQDELDLDRFDALVAEALNVGDSVQRAQVLREALAVWRGPALADLLYEPFAATEARRLELRRLEALEQRIDADLEAGLGPELVGELDALVAEHGLRERLVGQQMLALYRAGRQADALAAYRAARERLSAGLGLEPSGDLRLLEQRILEHDAALMPKPEFRVRLARHRRNRWVLPLVAAAMVTLVAGVITVALRTDSPSAPGLGDGSSRLLAVVLPSGAIRRSSLPSAPTAVVAGFGSIWAAIPNREQVVRIDAHTGLVIDRIGLGGQPSSLAAGDGGLWVAGAVGGTVSRIDPETDTATQTIRLGGANASAIAFGDGGLWIADATDRSLVRVSPETGSILQTIPLDRAPTSLAVGVREIWAASYDTATIDEIDRASGQVVDEVPVGQGPSALALANGSLWVTNSLDGTLTRIEAASGRTISTTPVGSGPSGLAVQDDKVYVANEYSGDVALVRAQGGSIIRRLPTGGQPTAVLLTGSRLWIGAAPATDLHRGGRLVLSGTTPPNSLDSAFDDAGSFEPPELTRLTYDTLVTFANTPGATGLRLVPDLALQLPEPTQGGTTYVFHLRPGIRYSDGRLVRASDFRRGIERLFKVGSAGTSFLMGIEGANDCAREPATCDLSRGVGADDAAETVTFRLDRPDPDFLFKLTEYAYTAPVPPGTPDRNLGWQPVPGTGPYRVVNAGPRGITLARNTFFREWSHAAQPDGFPDSILWTFPLSHNAEISRIEHGEADWTLDFIPVRELRAIERQHPAMLHVNPSFIVEFIPLNTTIKPFDNVKVRQAVNYAIDRRVVVQLYGGSIAGTPLCAPIPPGLPGYQPDCRYTTSPVSRTYRGPNLARARSLIRESGDRGARVVVWGETNATAVPPELPSYLVRMLRSIGLNASLRLVHQSLSARARRSIQLSVDGDWLPDFPSPASYLPSFFSCGGGQTHGYYCDPTLDRLMAKATAAEARGGAAVQQLWATANQRIVDEAYWVPTINLNEVDLVSSRLGNYEYSPIWGFLADQAWVR